MKADLLVYDVIECFSDTFSIFPLRQSFECIAQHHTQHPLDTFTRFKECARNSVGLLAASHNDALESARPAARSMQATRVAVRVFSILDHTAAQRAITNSRECSNESWTKERCKLYDENIQGIRLLYGRLPIWQKQLPSIAVTYLRCAVKVAQRRFKKATANLDGEDLLQIFTNYETGDTVFELEHLCDKLDNHVRSLRAFVDINCIIPETDPTTETLQEIEAFHEVLKTCRALVLQLNSILPILYVVNGYIREKLKNTWKEEIGMKEEWTLEDTDPEHSNPGAHFVDFSPQLTGKLIENIRNLRREAVNRNDILDEIAEAQICTVASADLACGAIAKMSNPELSAFGYTTRDASKQDSPGSSVQGSANVTNQVHSEKRVLRVRNNHLQSELFCTWCSIMSADKFLEKDLIQSDRFRSSAIQMYLPDEWYDLLISRILVPDLVINSISAGYQNKLMEASSRIMNRFAEKLIRSNR